MIRRALSPHSDGRLWGYRALVPGVHVASYERTVAPKVLTHVKAGNAGAFTQLLQRYPGLARQLRGEIAERRVTLRSSGADSRLQVLTPTEN